MTSQPPSYRGYRFPPEIISHAVWLYYRFGVSFRDVEDLLAERGITVTYEAIRQWCLRFGLAYARRLRHRRGRQGDTWYLDELFVKIQGRQQYLWRAVDEDGDVLDILRPDSASARCAGSSRPPICNASHPCTASCRTSSGRADICSALFTSVS